MAKTARRTKLTCGKGYVYWNPDAGEEYCENHPVESGECDDAESIRHSTEQEDTLYEFSQELFRLGQALAELALHPGISRTRLDGEMMSREDIARRFSYVEPEELKHTA